MEGYQQLQIKDKIIHGYTVAIYLIFAMPSKGPLSMIIHVSHGTMFCHLRKC